MASLMEEGGACFGVVVVQKNGMLHTNREVCTLDITPHNLQLRLPNDLMLQQPYTASMQVSVSETAAHHFQTSVVPEA